MPNFNYSRSMGFGLGLFGICCALALDLSGAGLEPLQGSWVTHKTNEDGQPYSQRLSFEGNKVRFEILDGSQQTVLVAKGTVTAERQGPFQVLTIRDISAGRSESDLEPIDHDTDSVYMLHGGTLFVASNLEQYRESQPPRLEAYKRIQGAGASAPAPDLSGTWKLLVTLNDQELEYELKLRREGPKYLGTLVSPRSGPHEMKSVEFTNGKLKMVIDRNINNTDATFTYDGKADGANKLSGQLQIRSGDNELSGSWKAEK